jgi:hypothetical protein
MPAHRSRTERWRESLHQIMDRNGGLEVSIAHNDNDPVLSDTPDLVWRVRILDICDKEVLLEMPAAAGKTLPLMDGVPLVCVMVVGQNRWMFKTRTTTKADGPTPFRAIGGVRILMPDNVERCTRREYYRVSTAELRLARVECWPLLAPLTVVSAEAANRAQIVELTRSGSVLKDGEVPEFALPEVGPCFQAKLVNVGGGGLGLIVERSEASGLDRARLLWMRLDLRPSIPAPIALTGKIAHTHVDSTQSVHVGVAFEFAYNPPHREFIVDQVQKFVARLQSQRTAA